MKSLKNLTILTMIFTLFLTSFSSAANAKLIKQNEDEQIAELAEMLEFIFEEAAVEDEHGNIIDLDIDMIENRYGTSTELQFLKMQREAFINQSEQIIKQCSLPNGITLSSIYDPVDTCILDKLKEEYGGYITGAIAAEIIALIFAKDFKEAAKKLIKAGIKGNAAAIAGNLSVIFFTCLWTHGDNPWN